MGCRIASGRDTALTPKSYHHRCQFEVVATDGRCLALTHCEPLNASEETSGFIGPLRAVREIAKTFAHAGEVEVSIVTSKRRTGVSTGITLTLRVETLIDDWRKKNKTPIRNKNAPHIKR